MKTIVKISAIAAIVALTGCSNTNAVRIANEARDTANEALTIANEARSLSLANKERIDRAFTRRQYK